MCQRGVTSAGGDDAVGQDQSFTGNPVIDAMTKAFEWLGNRVDQLIPRPPYPPSASPADMTDKELHHAIHDVGGGLLNGLAPVIQDSFVRYGSAMATSDPRTRQPTPVKVRGHVLRMVTEANDAFGLSLLGLREHASAAALGPLRFVAETLVWLKWLLESPDDEARKARAYRLTLNGIEGYGQVRKAMMRVGGTSEQTAQIAAQMADAGDRMRRHLHAMAERDGVSIPASPGRVSRLIEQYLPEHGGYPLYAVLSSAGTHPGPARAAIFYGEPGTGVVDYDFKGKYHIRAYWIAQGVRLHLDVCHLAAPVLGWDQMWDASPRRQRRRWTPSPKKPSDATLHPSKTRWPTRPSETVRVGRLARRQGAGRTAQQSQSGR